MKMVYVVMYYSHDDTRLVAVYSNKEEARSFVDHRNALETRAGGEYSIDTEPLR